MSKQTLSNLALIVFCALWAGFGLYYIMTMPKSNVVVYDCTLSEISPDFPIAVKEECRKHRSGRI